MRAFFRRTRVRLTLVYTAVVAVALCGGGAAFWLVFNDASLGAIDSSLRAQAHILTAGLRRAGDTVLFDGSQALPAQSADGAAIGTVVLSPDGVVLDQAGDPIPEDAARSLAAGDLSASDRSALASRSFGRRHERVLVEDVATPGGQLTLVLSHSLDEYHASLNLTAVLLGATVGISIVAAGISAHWLAGRALRPVGVITATARELGEHSLHRRINLDLPADELGSLASTFNAMLDRLESAFTALRRFTADAAHELRTPLAALRAEVDVVLRRKRADSEYRRALEVVLKEADRLSSVTEQLLLLARADAGSLTPEREPVDVADTLEEVGERWRSLAAETSVSVDVRAPSGGTVDADPILLRRLLDNLVDNAIKHSPPHAGVVVSAERSDSTWTFVVEDSGPGIGPEVRPLLFERFSTASGGGASRGAGLGLSLSSAIVRAHRGTLRLDDRSDGPGARVVVTLPADPARSSD